MALDTYIFFFSSRRRHTRLQGDWSSDVCSSDLSHGFAAASPGPAVKAQILTPSAFSPHLPRTMAAFQDIQQRETGLRQQLSAAQMVMIAIGGGIGTGLLIGSAFAIGFARARPPGRHGLRAPGS